MELPEGAAIPPRTAEQLKEDQKQLRELTLPNFITLLNAACGFLALAFALHDQPYNAAACVWVSAFLDALDGRIARWTDSATLLGKELDSLADSITFVCVPAFLVYARSRTPDAFIACVVYVCAGIFRLARFNVTAAHQSRFFLGVPTTLAACAIAATLFIDDAITYVVPARSLATLVLAYLMISRWRFPTYKDASPVFMVSALAVLSVSIFVLGPAAGGFLLIGAYFVVNLIEFIIRLAQGGTLD